MSAVPAFPPLTPARRAADLAHSRALRIALAASALAAVTALLARRVDLSTLADADVVWSWIAALAAAQPGLGRRQGGRLEGGARRAARPAPRALRGTSCRRSSSASCSTPCSSRASASWRASPCSGVVRSWPARASRRARSAARCWPSSSCSAAAPGPRRRRARAGAAPAAPWSGSSLIVFVVVLAVVVGALMVLLRSARGRFASLAAGLSRGQALFSKPRATARRDGRGHALVGGADRRHLGGARGLRHPRRPGRRGARLRLVDDRPAVPVLAGQPRHLPARRRRLRSSAPTRSRRPTRSPSASGCSSWRASWASASGSSSWPARASR